MKTKSLVALVFAFTLGLGWSWAWAQGKAQLHSPKPIPRHEVTVLVDIDPGSSDPVSPKIEGVAADHNGFLYSVDGDSGDVIRVDPQNPVVEVVGNIPDCARISGSFGGCFGVTTNETGDLFISASRIPLPLSPRVLRIPASDLASGFGTITDIDDITYVSGVNGVNGLAFDENGFLFTGGSSSGKVYLIPPGGGSFTVFNDGDLIPAACRCTDDPTLTCPLTGTSPMGCNPQRTVSNGVALNRKGDLFVADTARGAIWKVKVQRDNTGTPSFGGLSLFVQSPLLQGADGLIADIGNNFWAPTTANSKTDRRDRRRTEGVLQELMGLKYILDSEFRIFEHLNLKQSGLTY